MPRRAPTTDPVMAPMESESPSVFIAVRTACLKSSGERQKQYIALATAPSPTHPSPMPSFVSTSSGGFVRSSGTLRQVAEKSEDELEHRLSISL